MVAHAVRFEPVSIPKFVANRENYREFFKSWARLQLSDCHSSKHLADLEGNSLLKGTGNFFEGTANLNARAGNLNVKTGSRRRRPVNKPTYSQGQDWGDTEGLSDQGDSSEPPARLLGDGP
jgi:hypothetical protein